MQTATFVRMLLVENKLSQQQAADIARIALPTLRRRLYENSFTLSELTQLCKRTGMGVCFRDKKTGEIRHVINDPEELK